MRELEERELLDPEIAAVQEALRALRGGARAPGLVSAHEKGEGAALRDPPDRSALRSAEGLTPCRASRRKYPAPAFAATHATALPVEAQGRVPCVVPEP
jgi:hypothetical protein